MPDADRPLILSLFPGLGLLDRAFEEEWSGACVVRGPDVLWGGDVRSFHPPAGRFDGVIGGPPCQCFSSLAHLVRASGREPKFGNLIPEFERCVSETGATWFLMENVPAAPEPSVPGYGVKSFLLDHSLLNDGTGMGLEQRRVRRFSFGLRGVEDVPCLLRWIDLCVFQLPDAPGDDRVPVIAGHGLPPGGRNARRPTVTREIVNNSAEAKGRHRAPPLPAGHEQPAGLTARKKAVRAGAVTGSDGGASVRMGRYKLADALRLQGLREGFLDDSPFTAEGKLKAVANGVPLAMGRAIARAIRQCLQEAGTG